MADVSGCFSSSLVIKLNSWESNFMQQIFTSRNEELRHVWTVLLLSAINICLLWLAPCLVSVGTISTYAHLEDEISAANVFTALALVSINIIFTIMDISHSHAIPYLAIYTYTNNAVCLSLYLFLA